MATYKQIFGKAIKVLASDPSNEGLGQIWYNSTSSTFKTILNPAAWSAGGALPTARCDGTSSGAVWCNYGSGTYGDGLVLSGVEDTDWYADAGGEGKFKYDPSRTIDATTWDARAICSVNLQAYNGI